MLLARCLKMPPKRASGCQDVLLGSSWSRLGGQNGHFVWEGLHFSTFPRDTSEDMFEGPQEAPKRPKSAPRAPKEAPRRCRLEPPWELLGGSWGFLGASRTSRSHLQDSAFLFKCMSPRSQKKANPPSKNAIWGFAGGSQDGPKTAQKRSPRRLDQRILCEMSLDLLSNLGSSSLPKMCILCGRGRIFVSFGDLRFHTPEVALRGPKMALRALGLTSNMLKKATAPTQNAHFWPPKTAPRRFQHAP